MYLIHVLIIYFKRVPNFTPTCSTTSLFFFLRYSPFWNKCTEWPLMTVKATIPNVRLYVTSIKQVPNFSSFYSMARPNDPKMTLNPIKSNVPRICVTSVWLPNFSPFCSTASPFRVTSHFETIAPNDTKMTLNTTRSIVPHICVNSLHKFQMSLCSLYDQPFLKYSLFWDKCTE